MSRRSRSQRPPKARSSEAPVRDAPAAKKVAEGIAELSRETPAAPIDELAALDAGWDELMP
jgi:hypothetical protein